MLYCICSESVIPNGQVRIVPALLVSTIVPILGVTHTVCASRYHEHNNTQVFIRAVLLVSVSRISKWNGCIYFVIMGVGVCCCCFSPFYSIVTVLCMRLTFVFSVFRFLRVCDADSNTEFQNFKKTEFHMRVVLTDENGNIKPIDVEETTEFSMLQVLINIELQIPKDQQLITHDELGEISTSSTFLRFIPHSLTHSQTPIFQQRKQRH